MIIKLAKWLDRKADERLINHALRKARITRMPTKKEVRSATVRPRVVNIKPKKYEPEPRIYGWNEPFDAA